MKNTDVLAFAVEVVQREQRFPTVREVAERFGWASPTAAFRHLRQLALSGYIETRPGGRYRIVRLVDGTPAACHLVPASTRYRAPDLDGANTSYKRPSPIDRCGTNPVANPRDYHPRFIRLAREGRGTPAQQMAGQLLDAHGDAALLHLPADAPPNARYILEGCGCSLETHYG